jgi:hypothetical protein
MQIFIFGTRQLRLLSAISEDGYLVPAGNPWA